jgi:glycosyltransferase involved in cell wall biosynthesis
VLHCPDVVGGHAPQLARAERALGVASISVTLHENRYGYPVDESLSDDRDGWFARQRKRCALLGRALRAFDVMHFNFGSSIFGARMLDVPLLKRAGKAIFVTYQGDDARQGDYCRAHFDIHFAHEVGEGYYAPETDERKRRFIAMAGRHADGIYALNPDLLYVLPKGARFLPYANVDPVEWQPVGSAPRADGALRIAHAPSHRKVKGTQYLVDAVERLRASGVKAELELIEGMPRREARRLYEGADLVVDQLLAGWYGGLAVEAMALGKPVVSYLRAQDLSFVPAAMRDEIPVIDANPGSIYEVLRRFATVERGQLSARGAAGRQYVERWHDPSKIAIQVVEDYRRACS